MTTFAPFAIAPFAIAQSPPAPAAKAKPRSLDQQLLDDLDRELLKGLPGNTKPATPNPPPAGNERPTPTNPRSSATESQNPLVQIAERMRSVERWIAQKNTSPETQTAQDQIIHDLDALLKQGRSGKSDKQQGGGTGYSQAGQGNGEVTPAPPRESIDRIERGNKEAVETTDVKDLLRRIWGHLPPKIRDEMQATLSEQFLPQYERLIEDYYKRLAEER